MDIEATAASPADALPQGARILHIGPSKTGTTALQGACWAARADLARQGVHYAGNRRHSAAPARAVTRMPAMDSDDRTPPPMRWWEWMAREMRSSKAARTLYTSEMLAHADAAGARRIIGDIDPGGQVVITLRPLDSILASAWQQAIQTGSTLVLDDWLQRRFAAEAAGEHAGERSTSLWRAHRHGLLVRRWAAAAGTDRVTVVVADPRNHDFLFRAFEGLLALRPGTLQPSPDFQNRSLTLPEVELIRQVNVQAQAVGMGRGARNYLVLAGAARNIKRMPPKQGAPRVRLPAWAVERSGDLAAEALDTIRATGVRVVGDLDLLAPRRPESAEDQTAPVDLRLDPETAAAAALGVAYGTGLRLGPSQPVDDFAELPFLQTRDLARMIVDRGWRWLRRAREQRHLRFE